MKTLIIAVGISIVASYAAIAAGYVSKLTLPDGTEVKIKDADARNAIARLVDRVDGNEQVLPTTVSNLVTQTLSPQAFSCRVISDDNVEGYDIVMTDHVMNHISWDIEDGVSLGLDTNLIITNRTVTGKHNYSVLIDKIPEAALFEDFPVMLDLRKLVKNGYTIYCNYPMQEDNIIYLSTTNLPLIVQFDEPSPTVVVATIREMRQ